MEHIETEDQQKKTCRKVYCPGCGRYFASERVHALHRTGTYRSLGVPGSRRCLSDTELRAQGMDTEQRQVRFLTENKRWQAAHPVWFHALEREQARAYFAALKGGVDEEDSSAAP